MRNRPLLILIFEIFDEVSYLCNKELVEIDSFDSFDSKDKMSLLEIVRENRIIIIS